MNPQDVQTPASPLGSFPELAAMYRSSFQLPLSTAQTGSQIQADQTTVANQKAAQSASNYQVVKRPDGGFGFYDPSGKEISAADYATATGKNLTDVLKNSDNPIDKRFVQDYNDLNNYQSLKAQSNSDPQAAAKAKAIEDQVKNLYKIDLHKLTGGDVTGELIKNYPTVFGLNKAGISGSSLLFPTDQYATGIAKQQNPTGFYQGGSTSGQGVH